MWNMSHLQICADLLLKDAPRNLARAVPGIVVRDVVSTQEYNVVSALTRIGQRG
jgi:hypothetical protein